MGTAGVSEVLPQNGELSTECWLVRAGRVFWGGGGFNLQVTLRLTCAMFFLMTSPRRPFVNIYFIRSECILLSSDDAFQSKPYSYCQSH